MCRLLACALAASLLTACALAASLLTVCGERARTDYGLVAREVGKALQVAAPPDAKPGDRLDLHLLEHAAPFPMSPSVAVGYDAWWLYRDGAYKTVLLVAKAETPRGEAREEARRAAAAREVLAGGLTTHGGGFADARGVADLKPGQGGLPPLPGGRVALVVGTGEVASFPVPVHPQDASPLHTDLPLDAAPAGG